MKTLLLLLLLASCGKQEMPAAKDLNDDDGDQILNEHEKVGMDKYIAAVEPLEEIEAEIEFQSGISKLVKHKYILSNKTDLQEYSKDLMVKNLLSLKSNDHFSEFSILKMKEKQKIDFSSEAFVKIVLSSSKNKSTPKSLFLVYPDRKIPLGDWSPKIELEINGSDLTALLNGQAHLEMTHKNVKTSFWNMTQEESIRQKTYRVFLNNGKNTQIYYVSKDLDFERMLKYFNVSLYKNIEEENLLTTTIKPQITEWWIRKTNNRDIIIIKENLRELSDHYLKGFDKNKLNFERVNGKTSNLVTLPKHQESRILLKIRGFKQKVNFTETSKSKSGVQGRDGEWECQLYYRTASPIMTEELSLADINESLKLNGVEQLGEAKLLTDEFGFFWEVEVKSNMDHLSLRMENLPNTDYVQEGLFDKKCKANPRGEPQVKPNLQTPERSMTLKIEAFVEKI